MGGATVVVVLVGGACVVVGGGVVDVVGTAVVVGAVESGEIAFVVEVVAASVVEGSTVLAEGPIPNAVVDVVGGSVMTLLTVA